MSYYYSAKVRNTGKPKYRRMGEEEDGMNHTVAPIGPALSRAIHIGIPIASIVVILAFAVVTFLPANKNTLPVESTTFFIPIYLTIVVVLVFGSMYLFKRLMDTEPESIPAH